MWYIVRNGEVITACNTEEEALNIITNDESGTLEYYPEEGRIRYE